MGKYFGTDGFRGEANKDLSFGIMVAVLHQERAAIGLVLREKLHHALRAAVAPEEHLHVAVIYGVGIVRRAGVEEVRKRVLKAEAVKIHLHIVGDLIGLQAAAQVSAGARLLRRLVRIKTQALAAFAQKTQRSAFQVAALRRTARRQRRAGR